MKKKNLSILRNVLKVLRDESETNLCTLAVIERLQRVLTVSSDLSIVFCIESI